MNVEFICLANSTKHGVRCVAGIRLDDVTWFRPVSDLTDGTLKPCHYRLTSGSPAQILDVIEVEVKGPRSEPHQPENGVLGDAPWRLLDLMSPEVALERLRQCLLPGPALFGNMRDRVPYADLEQSPTSSSLALIIPTSVTWDIETSYTGTRQTRARFTLAGARYSLSVTDPIWRNRLRNLDLGVHPREAAHLSQEDCLLFTISLGGELNGYCYKLVAGVIVLLAGGN